MTQSRKPIPFYLVATLALFITFLAWSARQAATDGARITDRDYYSKGLRYNSSQVERQAASVLGWQVASELTGRVITLHLSDRNRQPVEAARIALTLLTPGEPKTYLLDEHQAGSYRIDLPASLAGEIPARYEIQSQGALLERNLLINLPAQENT